MVKLVDMSGMPAHEAAKKVLRRKLELLKNAGKTIQDALLWTVRNHVKTTYPGSQHYSPSKVMPKEATGNSGSIKIGIPGICRAYHAHTILPKNAHCLTIPMHRAAYGKSPKQFQDLAFIKKKDGKAFLAQKQGSKLVFMWLLAKKAFQKQDRRLMPDTQTLAANCFARLKRLM